MKAITTSYTIIIISLILFNSTLFSQLDLTVYTDKDVYDYGETIKLYAKVTNIADTTFEFLADNYETCQAEFTFNDYNSWEHTTCLPTAQLLKFMPQSSKIYSWIIEPQRLGLPNKEGTQIIIAKYYFNLVDTIYIQAPKFFGGEVELSYHVNNFDSVNTIRNNLNADVVFGSDYGEIKFETWQIEGYDIDSLIQEYFNDSIFVYFEKSASIGYENIIDENPPNYYPVQIGNKWHYEKIELESIYDPIFNFIVTDTLSFEVLADSLMPNGLSYFILNNEFGPGKIVRSTYQGIYYYNEIDTTDVLTFNYSANLDEYYPAEINYTSRVSLFSIQNEVLFGDSVSSLVFHTDGLVPFEIIFSEALGAIYFSTAHHEPVSFKLIGAEINNKTFGFNPIVGVSKKRNFTEQFSLSQNYPNPFNPTTTIEYSIPFSSSREKSKVKITVYDILGRDLAILVNENQSPGKHQIVFDASNLSSGIYYYSLKINDNILSKKMIVLK